MGYHVAASPMSGGVSPTTSRLAGSDPLPRGQGRAPPTTLYLRLSPTPVYTIVYTEQASARKQRAACQTG